MVISSETEKRDHLNYLLETEMGFALELIAFANFIMAFLLFNLLNSMWCRWMMGA